MREMALDKCIAASSQRRLPIYRVKNIGRVFGLSGVTFVIVIVIVNNTICSKKAIRRFAYSDHSISLQRCSAPLLNGA